MTEQEQAANVRSELVMGRLELVDRSGHACDFAACHAAATLRRIDYHGGHEYIGAHYCGFHAAALHGLRNGA